MMTDEEVDRLFAIGLRAGQREFDGGEVSDEQIAESISPETRAMVRAIVGEATLRFTILRDQLLALSKHFAILAEADAVAQEVTGNREKAEVFARLADLLGSAAAGAAPQSAPAPTPAPASPFQSRVKEWLVAVFGAEVAGDIRERNHRFVEEALELAQANGCTREEVDQIAAYVYGRPAGDVAQEVGGALVCLAALCAANHIDMMTAGDAEVARIWTRVDQIRAKHASKPKFSPLPGSAA